MLNILVNNYTFLWNKSFDFVLKNSKRLFALSLAFRVFIVFAFFAIMPLGFATKASETKVYKTKIKFNKNNPVMILSTSKKTGVELGESNFNRVAREQIERAVADSRTASQVDNTPSYNDPSDFRAIYQAAGAQFCIPWQLIEAVHQVESGKSGSTSTRSYAGAGGPMQFMAGTWRAYGVDGNNDGYVDANNVVDAIYGAAHLLAAGGAADGNDEGIRSALFNYNHAQWYVTKVITIAYEIGLPR